jgi:hypothetical protein
MCDKISCLRSYFYNFLALLQCCNLWVMVNLERQKGKVVILIADTDTARSREEEPC